MKTHVRIWMIMAVALAMGVMAAGINSAPVAADSCTAQLTYPVMPTVYAGSDVPIVVPLSVTCSTYYGTELYATANAYDTTSGTNLGSVSVNLPSVDGGNVFQGQVSFNLPPSTQGDTAQISASIYATQYGSPITTTSISFPVASTAQQIITTTTVTEAANQYEYPYPYSSPPFQYSPQYSSQSRHHLNQEENQTRNSNNTSMLAYVAILAILAAIVIATTGLVIAGRKRPQPQPYWLPPSPPPR
jgi:hypothetical protein